jgi:carboxypeptidase Taq
MVFMPAAAAGERGKQCAALAAVIHEKRTSSKLGELLQAAEDELQMVSGGLPSSTTITTKEQIRNIQLAKKDYVKNTCIPTELASKKAKLSSESHAIWVNARQEDDFSLFANVLGQCIDTAIEIAKCERQDPTKSVYATMLDTFETGMDPARIDAIFKEIKQALVPLIDKVLGPDGTPPSSDPLHGEKSLETQKELCNQLVQAIGYNTDHGRIDVSVHPFTSSMNPSDVRITSRFRPDEWYQGLAATLHEGGHAIYEQSLAPNGQPIDHALSMGMHESQSLFWERHVGLSKAFWNYAAPIVNEKFGNSYSPEQYYGAVNIASKSYIRVEAGELTYPLHVILRYEIERDFVEGKLKAEDIPTRWNADFKASLGLDVPSDAKGCLQDIHWSMMAYGYFPTYLLGAATAAQLEHYCRRDIPDFEAKIAAGEFAEIKSWLTEKIHKHGSLYESVDAHLEAQLGEKLNPKYFVKYLTDKYSELYQLS